MLRILLHIFRRKHITNADLKRAIYKLHNGMATNQPKIIEYQDLPNQMRAKCAESIALQQTLESIADKQPKKEEAKPWHSL